MKSVKSHVCFVLSATCAVLAVVVSMYSYLLVTTPRKGQGGILREIYGSGGFLVASIIALCGVVLSVFSIRKTAGAKGSSTRPAWSIGILAICGAVFLITLVRYLRHEF